MQTERHMFYNPQKILRDVQDKVKKVKEIGDPIDYLTFVPDGEPTLDINLTYEIDLLKSLGIKIAVITNGSLIWREDVREALMKADWVSLKIDSVQEEFWRRINRPYRTLQLSSIQQGMVEFARTYRGELVTETMLVRTVNDSEDSLSNIADLLARLRPDRTYLSIPTRPPAEEWAQPPPEEIINQAYHILHERIDQVEYLIGYEGNDFAFTGNVEEDLLSITAVHPMREEAVSDFLARAGADWSVIHRLIDRGQLIETKYKGRKFYMRRLPAIYTG
ncbi:MAG TPA: radical SAM protein [Desulfobacterales bacterium]|nr:radical SAM protein [Desulfobacterales bacterium]